MKEVRLHITRYLCGKPIKKKGRLVKVYKGFPARFLFLKPFLDNVKGIKFVLSILNITRGLKPLKRENERILPDFSTVVDPYKGRKKLYVIPSFFIKDYLQKRGLIQGLPKFRLSDMYLSNKEGPQGKSSLSFFHSLRLIYFNFTDMWERFKLLLKLSGSDSTLMDFNVEVIQNWSCKDPRKEGLPGVESFIGKIGIVEDPEGKRRIIAMLDYVSQFFLRKIHQVLLKCLEKIPEDRTFTQNPRGPWSIDSKEPFYSLDLTAATDRFPVFLQMKVLSILFDNFHFARIWKEILIKREFSLNSLTLDSVSYSVGQPMGAYSSWAAFTLTHHIVVAWAAHLCGFDNFSQYIILGDDIVIRNHKVAKKYIGIMMKLGVDVSHMKTHISKNRYEFAKRWIDFRNGQYVELTGLPLKGIITNVKEPRIVYSILYDFFYNKGNMYLYKGDLNNLVRNIYGPLYKLQCFYKTFKTYSRSFNFYTELFKYRHGTLTTDAIRKLMALAIKDSVFYPVGLAKEATEFGIQWVLSLGLLSQSDRLIERLYKLKCVLPLSVEADFNTSLYTFHQSPLVIGTKIQLQDCLRILYKYLSGKTTLNQLVDSMVFPDIETLTQFRRNQIEEVIFLDHLWRKSLNRLLHDDLSSLSEDLFAFKKSLLTYNEDLDKAFKEISKPSNEAVKIPVVRNLFHFNEWDPNFG
jgi:hypothetical protein